MYLQLCELPPQCWNCDSQVTRRMRGLVQPLCRLPRAGPDPHHRRLRVAGRPQRGAPHRRAVPGPHHLLPLQLCPWPGRPFRDCGPGAGGHGPVTVRHSLVRLGLARSSTARPGPTLLPGAVAAQSSIPSVVDCEARDHHSGMSLAAASEGRCPRRSSVANEKLECCMCAITVTTSITHTVCCLRNFCWSEKQLWQP